MENHLKTIMPLNSYTVPSQQIRNHQSSNPQNNILWRISKKLSFYSESIYKIFLYLFTLNRHTSCLKQPSNKVVFLHTDNSNTTHKYVTTPITTSLLCTFIRNAFLPEKKDIHIRESHCIVSQSSKRRRWSKFIPPYIVSKSTTQTRGCN